MGAKNFGFGIVEETPSSLNLIATHHVCIAEEDILEKAKSLSKILKNLKSLYQIETVGYEFSVMRNKVGRTIDILSGIVISEFMEGYKVHPVNVSTCKKFFTGTRAANKTSILDAVCNYLSVKKLKVTHHESDALAIAIYVAKLN
ncbi:MAG: crossover junction endodeoxyribonuclease RuvC [Candidatus Gracilibacteria bacterium]